MNLTEDNAIRYYSSSTLEESLNDDFRFESDYWDPWSQHNQIFMSRILILGSTGMLGTMVSRYFLNLEDYDVALTTRAPGQESNESYIFKYDASVDEVDSLIQKVNPDYVINCIGIIKPEIDEANQQSISNAININSYFPLQLSNNAEVHKFKYIQIGTDCVFSEILVIMLNHLFKMRRCIWKI